MEPWMVRKARRGTRECVFRCKDVTLFNESPSLLLRPQQREQNDVADRFRASEQHGEPVDADAKAARRRHAVLECDQEFFVDLLCLFACLFEQTLTLQNWIV